MTSSVFYSRDEHGIVNAVEMTASLRFWLVFINYIDFTINILGVINLFFNVIVFYKCPQFHQNLVFLFWNCYLGTSVPLTCGLVKCIACIYDFELLAHPSYIDESSTFLYRLEALRAWSVFAVILSASCGVSERLWATIKLQSYEKSFHPKTMAVLILVCWALAFGNVVLCFKLRLYLTAVSILGTVALYMGIIFHVGYRINRKQLSAFTSKATDEYVLSQRFQLTENLRVFSVLRGCTIMFSGCTSVGSIFLGSVIILTNMKMINVPTRNYVLREAVHIMTGVSCNVILFYFITGTYIWRQTLIGYLKRLLVLRKRHRRVEHCDHAVDNAATRPDKVQIKNADGVQLAFNAEEAANMYFQQLNALWA